MTYLHSYTHPNVIRIIIQLTASGPQQLLPRATDERQLRLYMYRIRLMYNKITVITIDFQVLTRTACMGENL